MDLQTWALSHLSHMGISDAHSIVSSLIKLESESLVEEYLSAMLDKSNPSDKKFISEFLQRFSEDKFAFASGFYRKPIIDENDNSDRSKSKGKDKEKQKTPINSPSSANGSDSGKKKTKYVSLYTEEGQDKNVILLPGRHRCNCQASKHKLINNCLKCGRIVCEQEGSGPCSFCGKLVMSNEETEVINRGSKKSETLYNKLINTKKISGNENDTKISKGLQTAIEHKNKLIEYDRTSEQRTRVFDDECDYFQINSKWTNPAEKEKLKQHEEKLRQNRYDRSNRKVTIDLLGRKVVENDKSDMYDPNDPVIKSILENSSEVVYKIEEVTGTMSQFHLSRPIYVDNYETKNTPLNPVITKDLSRIQDKELQEMRDEGMCLSMHQPWASLLVMGIKKHEGRTWYNAHRGRLWIASATKIPTPAEITQVEQMYRVVLKNDNIKFPQNYPHGCLLGCVDVTDVFPQEEYRCRYPKGESDSPYVFICENFQEMVIKFPMRGSFKIYKLDTKMHQAAKKALRDP